METKYKPHQIVWGLVAANLAWRLVWLPVSRGAYTDGILQLTSFREGITYWPPLYTALAHLFAWIPPVGLEGSARLVSAIAASLAVIPIEYVGRRLFGQRAGLLGVLAYTLSPIPLRWSVQPMTDATFMAFWMASLGYLTMACGATWPDLFEQTEKKSPPDPKAAGKALLLASLMGALAALTRYQGLLLLPLLIVAMLKIQKGFAKHEGPPGIPPVVSLAPWLLVVGWGVLLVSMRDSNAGQAEQFASRAAASPLLTGLNYLFLFEQFVLTSPYFVGYGIFGFFLFGLLRINFGTKRILQAVWVGTFLTAGLLVVHSAFQAFQTRYLLPIVPFLCMVAGHGMGVWEKRCKDHPKRFYALLGLAMGHAVIFSCLVAYFQGSPFLDVKRAGEAIREHAPQARVFTIEDYGKLGFKPAKLAFWSGRDEKDIGQYVAQPELMPGDLIVLSSFYGAVGVPGLQRGGYSTYRDLLTQITAEEWSLANLNAVERYPCVVAETFSHVSVPLLPDIMQEPLTHTNPLAWYLRYVPQSFQTTILKVATYDEWLAWKANDQKPVGLAAAMKDVPPPVAAEAVAPVAGEVVETIEEVVVEEAPVEEGSGDAGEAAPSE